VWRTINYNYVFCLYWVGSTGIKMVQRGVFLMLEETLDQLSDILAPLQPNHWTPLHTTFVRRQLQLTRFWIDVRPCLLVAPTYSFPFMSIYRSVPLHQKHQISILISFHVRNSSRLICNTSRQGKDEILFLELYKT